MKNHPVDDEAISWAYRVLFGRDPENEQAINDKRGEASVDGLMAVISA